MSSETNRIFRADSGYIISTRRMQRIYLLSWNPDFTSNQSPIVSNLQPFVTPKAARFSWGRPERRIRLAVQIEVPMTPIISRIIILILPLNASILPLKAFSGGFAMRWRSRRSIIPGMSLMTQARSIHRSNAQISATAARCRYLSSYEPLHRSIVWYCIFCESVGAWNSVLIESCLSLHARHNTLDSVDTFLPSFHFYHYNENLDIVYYYRIEMCKERQPPSNSGNWGRSDPDHGIYILCRQYKFRELGSSFNTVVYSVWSVNFHFILRKLGSHGEHF